MNNEQLKLKIINLSERRKMLESFVLPLVTGLILALISPHFLGNILYLSLFSIGGISILLIVIKIGNLNARIESLIKEIV